jgi:hypothetical protein
MTSVQGYFSSQASPVLLPGMREIARREGSTFQAVLEEAMRNYIRSNADEGVRPEVMAHFQASLERNWRLAELLADT